MSLNFNLSKIQGYERLCFGTTPCTECQEVGTDFDTGKTCKVCEGKGVTRIIEPMTENMVFMTMHIGMGQITEKNHLEWYTRAHLVELVLGPAVYKMEDGKKTKIPIQLMDVKRHIGLGTNASTKTRSQFLKFVWRLVQDDAVRRLETIERAPIEA